MKSLNSRPAPSHSSASAPRFASFSAWIGNGGRPSRSPMSSGTETPVQPRFGATSRRPSLSTRPGSATTAPAVRRSWSRDRRERVAREPREVVEHVVDRAAAVVAGDQRAVALVAGEVGRAHGEEVDAELEPEADDPAAAQLDGQRGTADRAAQLHLGLAHQAEVDQLADEARDGRLVESGLLRDRRARARPVLGDVPQHHAQVVAAHGALVRRGATRVVRWHVADPNASSGGTATHVRVRTALTAAAEQAGERALARLDRGGRRDELQRLGLRDPVGAAAGPSAASWSTSSETASRLDGSPSGSPSSSSVTRNQPVCSRSV